MSESSPSPPCSDLLTSCESPLDAVLLTEFVCEMTEGEAGEEIWSSVNYLFILFYFDL